MILYFGWKKLYIMENKLGVFICENRKRLGLTITDLNLLSGISKQYLNNLEKSNAERNISTKKLKRLILILSSKTSEVLESLLENAKNRMSDGDISEIESDSSSLKLIDDEEIPSKDPVDIDYESIVLEKKDIDFDILKNFVFLATDLVEYVDLFLEINNNLGEKKDDISKFINSIEGVPIEELNHNYEVWTVSDVLSENISDNELNKTVSNILFYKIKYVNFIDYSSDFEAKIAYAKIEKVKDEILKGSDASFQIYWNDNDFFEYFKLYGISTFAFFSRLRIFNPLSVNICGTYNIGGKTLDSIKFVDIESSVLNTIRDNLSKIITTDNAGLLLKDDENLLVLNSKVKKFYYER